MLNIKSLTFTAGIATLLLSACATAPNPLSLEERDQFFLKSTNITWDLPEKEQETEDEKDAKDSGQRAEGRKQLQEKLNLAIMEEFKDSPSGPNAMNFEVKIQKYDRTGAVVSNVVGGGNLLIADVIATDASSGEELGVYPGIHGAHTSNFGVLGAVVQAATKPDIPGVMSNDFAKRLKKTFNSEKVNTLKEKEEE